jgi:hypothetical protein
VVVGVGGDLRQVGDAEDLAVAGQASSSAAPQRRHRANAGVDCIER